MAQYQLAHDGFDGRAYSGVISGGKFIACAHGSQEWADYVKWVGEGNKPDPWRSPEDGGQALSVGEGDLVVGSMLYSIKGYDPDLTPPPPESAHWSKNMLNLPAAPVPAAHPAPVTTGSAARR